MSKNFTKIFILFSFISLISCSYLNEAKTKYSTKPASSTPRVKLIAPQDLTHNQFESRNLNTAQENKEKTKIALFFPISGKNSDLGMHLFNAAVLSLFENDTNHDIELILIDSKDTPQESLAAFQTIIDRKIKIVIGPIYSSAIDAIKERAKTNEITILSLSNNHQLAGNINDKGGVFLSGFTIETQLDKIVSFSMKKNRTNFAILAPNNQYGHTVTNILKTIVDNRDGNFTASEVYDSNLKRLEKSVERIVNSFAVPSELAEGGGNKLRKDFKASEVVRSYVQVIVVPETGKNLSKIAELIKKYNIEAVFTNHDYEPYAIERDEKIASLLTKHNISFFDYKDQVIFEKNEVLKDNRDPYTVFTPYSRKWKLRLTDFHVKPYPNKKYFKYTNLWIV